MAGEEQRPQTQSLQVARSLWRTVVGSGAAPTVSLRAERAPAAASVVSRVTPRTRSLREPDAARDAAPDSDFNLLRRLGEGGMGVVYAAEQLALAREIAIKRIRPEEAGGSDAAAKFLAEAIVTGALDHPNVVPIYDIGRAADGSLFYAMKEVTGTCWADALREKPIEENLRILLAVCDAVAFAHDKGVIHRDLKPDNVMLGAYGEVVVMDWGLAASVGSDKAEPLTREAGLAGTPAYMAPEMALCAVEHIGKASDIYLLGGILYELTTGRRPHAGEDVYACIAAAMDNIIQPTTQSGELVEIARRAMATEPGERYASVQEFQQAIRGYLSHMESLRLSAAADARLLVLAKVDEDDLYREATEIIAGQQQALELWPSNHQAALGLRRARETMAGLALERGDLTLAKSQVAAMEAEQGQFALNAVDLVPIEVLSARISTALAAAAARERLVRLSTWAAVLAGLAALSLTSGAYWVTRQERDRALAAERLAVVERDRALTAEAREGGLRRVAEDALQTANPRSPRPRCGRPRPPSGARRRN
jgi:hypothetical protein